MEQITTMMPRESARLDAEQLEKLYLKLGEAEADNVLCRAMEEIASLMKLGEKQYSAAAAQDLRKTVQALKQISEEIGLNTMSRICSNVVACIDKEDWIALGATFTRLLRSSDQSLTAIWDLQDVTI